MVAVSASVYHAPSKAKKMGSQTASGESVSTRRIPHVLTRSVIPSLVTGLDASDVLECYYLTRQTKLHGIANSTISITKAALGLRHRLTSSQTAASSPTRFKKRPLALTLEYGPIRAAENVQHDSLPLVVHDTTLGQPVSVAWENEAKIYYTQEISSEDYPTANYLASLSGAALNTLLLSAVDYSERHRRYQPFTVVDETGELLGHSNSDVDFLFFLYQQLATLGVSLQPVLVPTHFQVQLHALSAERIQMGSDDVPASEIAAFFAKLTRCVQAIATADYSSFYAPPSSLPSVAPSADIETASGAPSQAPQETDHDRWLAGAADNNDTSSPTAITATPSAARPTSPAPSTAPSHSPTFPAPSTFPTLLPTISSQPTGSALPTQSSHPTTAPTSSPLDPQTEAKQAAAQAQQAADDAQQAGNSNAAKAAQAAATAAQHAADLTASQQAGMHQDWLLQGDGHSVASAVSLCFSDDLYELQSKNSGSSSSSSSSSSRNDTDATATTTATAYLYWDGSFYVRLELIPPFVSVVPMTDITLPQPLHGSALTSGKGDFVDWTLTVLILSVFLIGVLLLLQQVLGRNLRVIRPLYKFQQWFFDPRHYYESQQRQQEHQQLSDSAMSESQRSGVVEQEYTFGEDVIPLSMGGRKAPFPLRSILSKDKGNPGMLAERKTSEGWRVGDVEMTSMRAGSGHDALAFASSDDSDDGGNYVENDGVMVDGAAPERLFRDPDLVDFPDLKSRSKVAVPVSMATGGSSHSLEDSTYG